MVQHERFTVMCHQSLDFDENVARLVLRLRLLLRDME